MCLSFFVSFLPSTEASPPTTPAVDVPEALARSSRRSSAGTPPSSATRAGSPRPATTARGELITEALQKAGNEGKCTIGLDVAASEFHVKDKDAYDLDFKYV